MMITCTPCFILCSNNEVSVNLVSSFLFFLGREKGLRPKVLMARKSPGIFPRFHFLLFFKKKMKHELVFNVLGFKDSSDI